MGSVLEVQGLSKQFGRVAALEDVSLDTPEGATHFLLGPNGSGKTTLIRLLTGVQRPTRGRVRVLGEDPYHHPERIAEKVGIAYEDHFLPPWATGEAYLRFAAEVRGFDGETTEQVAARFDLSGYWGREMGTYSAGMRKRIILAQAWLGDPPLVLLDEPFSNLDPGGRHLLATMLRTREGGGATTLVSTHLAETVSRATHLAVLVNGQLEAHGSMDEISERYGARVVSYRVADPGAAARYLLEKGASRLTVTQDSLSVRGDSTTISRIPGWLQEVGIEVEATEENYDVWAIYRSVLSARQDQPGDEASVSKVASESPQEGALGG